MRKLTFVLLIAVMLIGSVACAQDAPQVDLPVFPDAEPTMEVNVSNEDILPIAKAMLPMLTNKLGSIGEKITPEQVADILRDVNSIQVLQLNIVKKDVTEEDIAKFYNTHLPTGDWTRVFWQAAGKMGNISIYVKNEAAGLYGYRIRTVLEDGAPVKRVEVAKIDGKIDFTKLLEIAAGFMVQ